MRGRWLAAWCLALSCDCALIGCDNDLDQLFARDTPNDAGRDAGGQDGGNPAPPVTAAQAASEIYGPECASCVAQECAREVAQCAADDECAAEALCLQKCLGPECHQECSFSYAPGGRPVNPLEACAVDACIARCPIGRDFSCVGLYGWPAPKHAVTQMTFQLATFEPAPLLEAGIRARVCPSRADPGCTDPRFEARSSATGEMTVSLPNGGGDNKPYTPFKGFLAFDDPEPPLARRVMPTLVFFDFSFRESYPFALDTLLATPERDVARFFEPAEPGKGVVAGPVHDCTASQHARAIGLQVTLEEQPDARVRYFAGDATGPEGMFIAPNVEPGFVTVLARDGGRTVASIDVPVVADTITYVWLFPLTADR